MLAPDTVLQNRYRILSRIGGGAMGTVYLAEDARLQSRHCAVKEMSPDQLAPQDRDWSIDAFRQEVQLLAQLHHPGLTSVTDFFDEFGNWYLVMDYVEGETLQKRLESTPAGRFPVQEALRIALQILDVLIYLHTQPSQVVFRDLKPSNVMITPEGQVKLIDFGIARFFKPGKAQDTAFLGTPGHAAPEQYGGLGQSDARTDIYCLGVLLNQMVTGFDPTTAISPFPLPNPRVTMPTVPPALAEVIVRATQMRPELRYSGAGEMRRALFPATAPAVGPPVTDSMRATGRRVATQVMPQPIVVGAQPAAPRRKVGIWIGLGASLGLLLVCGVGIFVVLSQDLLPLRDIFQPETAVTTSRPLSANPSTLTATSTREVTPEATLNVLPEVDAEPVSSESISPTPTETSTPVTPTPVPLRLAFVRGDVGNSDVYVANADGGDPRCVACGACDEAEPAWSPDGRSLAYQANCEGSYDIWVADLATGAATRVTQTTDVDEREPDWSPDGSRFVYRATPKDVGRNEDGDLFAINRDGSGSVSLSVRGRSPTWSPDGSRVVLMSERDGSWEIYVVELSSRDTRKVTSCDANCRWPSWSPDGSSVIYHATTGAGSVTADAIWVTPLSGGSATLLVAGQHAGRPSWSGEGVIVFNSESGIEVVTAQGLSRRTLIPDDANWAPVWSR